MTEYIEPQLARSSTLEKLAEKDWTGWFISPKHDGMRAVVVRTPMGVLIQSRTNKPYADHVPHLRDMFMDLPVGTVLDGELAIIDHTVNIGFKSVPVVDFNKTMRIMGTGIEKAVDRQDRNSINFIGEMSFIGFDIMSCGIRSLIDERQDERFNHLLEIRDLLVDPSFVVNPGFGEQQHAVEIFNELVAAGIEGVIMKTYDAKYLPGKRNSGWLKVKAEQTYDVVVMGFTDAKEGKTGKWLGKIGAIEFGAYLPDGTLQYVGRCSGMDDATRDAWTVFRDLDAEGVRPILDGPMVIEVKANELVGSGEYRTPRHPQYVTQRIDKRAVDCKMEQFK